MNLLIIDTSVHGHGCVEIAESLRMFKKINYAENIIFLHGIISGEKR